MASKLQCQKKQLLVMNDKWNKRYIGVLVANVIYIAIYVWIAAQFNY